MLEAFYWIGEDEAGTSAIEYGFIVSLVSIAIIIALGLLGESLADILNVVSGVMQAAA